MIAFYKTSISSISFFLLMLPFSLSAQFRGGSNDGVSFNVGSNLPLGRNIFKGGNDDGSDYIIISNLPLGRNIFKGGIDDGSDYVIISNLPLGRNIFKGGIDDGSDYVIISNLPLGRNIFKGGNDDGVTLALSGNQPLGRNIFTGGINDGWAMAFAPTVWLPVTLSDFNGKWQSNDALITWKTLTEINSSHFELERSFDGVTYTNIKTVTAAGQSNAVRSYSYTDMGIKQLIPAGTAAIYYRLRTVDKDGKATYSGVVILKTISENRTEFAVFPNPARDHVVINSNGLLPDNSAAIRLADISGKVLLIQKIVSNQQQLSVEAYANGTYFLQVLSGNKVVYTQKIIIQK